MTGQRRAIIVAAALLAIAVVIGPAQAEEPPLRVGALLSLTNAGATSGVASLAGLKMAVAEINAAGGIAGRKLEIIPADDQTDPTAAVNEARRLVFEQHVDLVIGPLFSNLTLATLPIFTQAKIANITQASAPVLTPEKTPYSFSMTYPATLGPMVMIHHLKDSLHARSVALIIDNGTASRENEEVMRAEIPKAGIALTGVQEYANGDTDMTPQLLSLRHGNPDVLLLFSVTSAAHGYIQKGLAEIGWPVQVVGSAAVGMMTADPLRIAGPDAYAHTLSLNVAGFTACGADPEGATPFARFRDKLRAADPAAFPRTSPANAAYFYDAPYILKAAIEGDGGKVDGPSIAAWIEANGHTLHTLNGDARVSAQYHFMLDADSLLLVEHPERTRPDGLQKRYGC